MDQLKLDVSVTHGAHGAFRTLPAWCARRAAAPGPLSASDEANVNLSTWFPSADDGAEGDHVLTKILPRSARSDA